ncbi:leucyl/phenylalanyl-tRNA--protein transferase [Ottowia sp. GY511]|uniref:Leucyl/phenylalanyl-tRNA--protein transferase n=1 Tax=Ottowia flava TaxID=2675430 RepID=A0ABW4KV84_9BURK|nr:leucyl/phenylalanyl-tRNA--protein transferase [Ottowia sp. GY511]TXK33418.1 leucyl/phenylalanyl-tRNA--protein transferase [Ottowia sp. GY511]
MPALTVLRAGDAFPPVAQAWGPETSAPGLVAAGGELDVATLRAAYSATVFPWFSEGEPILWWSPDPRMVLRVNAFRLHRSLRKAIERFRADPACEIRFDTAFDAVVGACSAAARPGQEGTWIGPDMRRAYGELHRAGYAHSVEAWVGGELVAGLYGVGIGHAVFGESMFTRVPDGSKIALAALVAWCIHHGVPQIDCQQNTPHLAFMGAGEVPRAEFAAAVSELAGRPSPPWKFDPVYWNVLLPPRSAAR